MKVQVKFRALGGTWYMGLGVKGIENTTKSMENENVFFFEEHLKSH